MKAPSAATVKKAAKYSGRAVTGVISLIFRIIGTIFLIVLLTGMIFGCFFAVYIKDVLSDELNVNLNDYSLNQSSIIYYKDSASGQWLELETLYSKDGNSIWTPYKEIPKNLEHAAVAIEDKRFYDHNGVDWYRTGGAVYTMFTTSNSSFGGSSITQQLIKNLTLDNDVTVQRKLTEIFRALDFEKRYTKEQIMESYLNNIPLGRNCVGVGAAARVYFNKDVSELDLAECASLIGITNNPSRYDPFLSEKTRENNKDRQETILWRMREDGYITEAEYDEALAEPLVFQKGTLDDPEKAEEKDHWYSWFTDAVIKDVIRDLAETKNISEKAASNLLWTGGYKIYTTLDPSIQAKVDEIFTDPTNLPENLSKKQPLQSAILIMDPYTGDIVAMAGGVGEKIGNRIFNGATDQKRPPGSSIKPIAIYAPAMDLGYISPWTLFYDSTEGNLVGRADDWWPKNSGGTYYGLVPIQTAIEHSLNTVSVQVLDKLTPQVSFNFLRDKLHVTSLVLSRDGHTDADYAPLGLGQLTDGISLREEASAYTIFPNKGIYTQGRTYSRVLDSNNNVIIDNVPLTTVAVSEDTAYQMTQMLRRAASTGTGAGARLKDVTGIPMAGKTGTSSGSSDRWFAGFTPYYVAVCWTGYEYPETIPSSNNPASSMFSKVMSLIHHELDPRDFQTPQNMKQVTVCMDSGLLATEACHHDIRGDHTMTLMMPVSSAPTRTCDAHVWQDFCKLQVETYWGDGNLAVPGTISGTFTDQCPAEDRVTAAVLDPSKCSYSVPTPQMSIPYVVGKLYSCYVHTNPAYPVATPEPTPDPFEPYITPEPWPPEFSYPEDPLFPPDPTPTPPPNSFGDGFWAP